MQPGSMNRVDSWDSFNQSHMSVRPEFPIVVRIFESNRPGINSFLYQDAVVSTIPPYFRILGFEQDFSPAVKNK